MSKVLVPSAPEAHEVTPREPEGSPMPWLALVAEKVKTLHYGVIQIVVHDSRVVQVERTERHRFDVPRSS